MANYVIGDVQGCFVELQHLLAKIKFSPAVDRLYFVGDLVNRGPFSLQTLRWVYQNRDSVSTVLGNHDLFLLSCWLGFSVPRAGDTIADVLTAPDVDELLNWLIQQPLMMMVDQWIIVHAGVYPGWSFKKAFKRAENARLNYSGEKRREWFFAMFGNQPAQWDKRLADVDKFRFVINSFTRMRFCSASALDFKYKGEIEGAPAHLLPWFRSDANLFERQIIFGHWSALGLQINTKYICLDTGCIWGGELTAYCLGTGEVFSVSAMHAYQDIVAEK